MIGLLEFLNNIKTQEQFETRYYVTKDGTILNCITDISVLHDKNFIVIVNEISKRYDRQFFKTINAVWKYAKDGDYLFIGYNTISENWFASTTNKIVLKQQLLQTDGSINTEQGFNIDTFKKFFDI